MRERRTSSAFLLVIGTLVAYVHAGTTDTTFTYQGQLKQVGVPVTGETDMMFSLLDQDGALVARILMFNGQSDASDPVVVKNGLFTVELDFGADVFNGEPRFLAISVRYPHDPRDTELYTALTPTQHITGVPYALNVRGLAIDDTGGVDVEGDIRTPGTVAASAFDSNSPLILKAQGTECARFDDATCNFGLGETNPLATLHIGGTPGVDGIMFPDGTLQTTAAAGGGGGGFWAANGADIQNTNAGHVGIGIAPGANEKLYVEGGARFTGSKGVLIDGPFNSSAHSLTIYAITSGNTINVLNDGNLGGSGGKFSSSTGYGVEAYGGTNKAAVYGSSSSGPGAEFVFNNASNGGIGVLATSNGSGGSFGVTGVGTNSAGGLRATVFGSGNAVEAVVVGGTGHAGIFLGANVGMGTNNPRAPLHVAGTADATLGGGGLAVFGEINGGNVVIDGNEIMARSNGSTSPLFLNNNGGDIRMGGAVSMGYEQVSSFQRDAFCVTVYCPAGKQVLGGGCDIGVPDWVATSTPAGTTGWTCCADVTDANVTSTAICANIK